MKKILIGLLLTVSVFLGNTYAGGHPTSSSNVLVENIDEISGEPDYNFEVNSQEDFYEMLKILYKYYNIYNLKNYNNENTGEVVGKIEEIEGILNPLVEIYIPTHWTVSEFTLGKSNQEANTDLLKSLGHDVGHIGIFTNGFGTVIWEEGKSVYATDFYALAKDVENIDGKGDGDFELDGIVTEDLLSQYSIYEVPFSSEYLHFNIKTHVVKNSLKGNYSTHIGYYIKEGENYIKVPTYANNPYVFDNTDFTGIGATFYSDSFRPYLFDVIPDGSASKAGLQRFDLITKVNGRLVLSPQGNMIFGEKGDIVNITVLRKGKFLDFEVIIDDVLIPDMLSIDNYSGYLSRLEKIEEIEMYTTLEGEFSLNNSGIYNDDYSIDNYDENNNYVALINAGAQIGQSFLLNDGTVNKNVIEKKILGKNFTIKAEDILTDYEGKKLDYEVKIYVKIGDQYYYGGRDGESSSHGGFELSYEGKESTIAVRSERAGFQYSKQLGSVLEKYEEKVGAELFKETSSKLKSKIGALISQKIEGLRSEEDFKVNETLFHKLYALNRLAGNYEELGKFCYICSDNLY